jgi:hypothetical protein
MIRLSLVVQHHKASIKSRVLTGLCQSLKAVAQFQHLIVILIYFSIFQFAKIPLAFLADILYIRLGYWNFGVPPEKTPFPRMRGVIPVMNIIQNPSSHRADDQWQRGCQRNSGLEFSLQAVPSEREAHDSRFIALAEKKMYAQITANRCKQAQITANKNGQMQISTLNFKTVNHRHERVRTPTNEYERIPSTHHPKSAFRNPTWGAKIQPSPSQSNLSNMLFGPFPNDQ